MVVAYFIRQTGGGCSVIELDAGDRRPADQPLDLPTPRTKRKAVGALRYRSHSRESIMRRFDNAPITGTALTMTDDAPPQRPILTTEDIVRRIAAKCGFC